MLQRMHRTEARLRMGLLNTAPNNVKPLNDTRQVVSLSISSLADHQGRTEWSHDTGRIFPVSGSCRPSSGRDISLES